MSQTPEAAETAPRQRRERSARESLGSIIFGFEFIVIALGSLAAFGLKVASPAVTLGVGAVLVVLSLLAIPAMRYRWGVWLGWTVQGLVLLSGVWVHMMVVVGLIFLAIWAYAMVQAARIERYRAAVDAAAASSESHHRTENPS